jgi:RNA polymerase sigma factor (sigma-70 family)
VNTKETQFLQLLNENKGILFKICKIYQDNADDRNDLLQEMTLQLWLAFDSFRGESKFSSWMYRVSLNTAIVFFKKQKRRPDSEQLPNNFEQIEDNQYGGEKEERLALFYKAVQQLNKIEKALIYLYMENQTYEEIADNLGITALNARVRLNRIKNRLKEIIKNTSYEY